MLKNSSKRKSIYKEFPIQQINNTNVNSGNKSNSQQMSLSSTKQSSSFGGSVSVSSQQKQDQQLVQFNQKLSIMARLIPEDQTSQKYEQKEGSRRDKCIFKLNKHEIQIIQPDEKKILEEIDAFQKRERIQHSPLKSLIGNQREDNFQRSISPIGQQQNINYNSKQMRDEGNAQKEDLNQNQKRNNFLEATPEREKNIQIKPFQSPISKISYFESSNDQRPNTFTFDQIFDETVNDEEFFNNIKQMYLGCIRDSKNLVIINLNRSLINSHTFFREFISGLINMQKLQGFSYLSSQKSQFFLQSYEILHPTNEKYLLLDLQPINKQNPDDLIKEISIKLTQIPRKQTQSCTVFNFQLFDDNKLINEIVIIDMYSFLDKKQVQSQSQTSNQNSYQQNYNSYCKDLISLLNLQQTGKINTSDQFLQILLQKFKLSDELIVLANFKVIQPHITTNYYLLLLSQILYKQKTYLNSIFIHFCQIQSQYIHHFLGRDLSYDASQLSVKEENQILSQKNLMIKEQVRIITADLIHHQEQLSKLQKENYMYLSDIKDLKKIISDQDSQLLTYKKTISEQTNKIDGMKKNFGILDNFDKSMVIDSKNKSYNRILTNIYSTKKQFYDIETHNQETQTELYLNNQTQHPFQNNFQDDKIHLQNKNIQNVLQSQQDQHICKNCKMQLEMNQTDSNINNQINYKSFHAMQDFLSSDLENQPFFLNEDDKSNIITPNRFLQNLDDLLLNLDSKKSTYFSPRNLSLANLALIENEGYKQKLLIKEQEVEKLQSKLKELSNNLTQKENQFKFKDQERLGDLKQIEKLINIFEKKLVSSDEVVKDLVEYYENELFEVKNIIQFSFQAYSKEIKELKKDINVINQEKQQWGIVFAKKTEEIYKQMSNKIQQKNEKIKQYEEVLQKFGQLTSYK